MSVAPEPVTEEPVVSDDDAFANAFANLAKDEPAEPAAPVVAEEPAVPEPVVAEEPVVTEEGADPAAAEAEKPPVVAAANPDEDKLLQRLAKVLKEDPAPTPVVPQLKEQEAPQLYTADEVKFLEDYDKDWPDVARAESLRRRGEYNQLTGYIFSQIMGTVGPMQQMLQQLAEHSQYSQLTTTVPDYDDVRDKVVEWVGNQPSYLQNAYQHVIRQGTVDEINDLISRYKAETGHQAAGAPALKAAGAPLVRKDTELPTATKQAAASLAPVSSKRTVVPQTDDLNNFEAAFAKFAIE